MINTSGSVTHLSFVNPAATGHDDADHRIETVTNYFLAPSHDSQIVAALPHPNHFESLGGNVFVTTHGGDGTVRRAIGAIIGHVPNHPEATAANYARHHELAKHITYFALAGGNACNWALSAHGLYAKHPERLSHAKQINIGMHRPLLYDITDENGEIVLSDIATSCLGLGGAALAASVLEAAKPELKHKPPFKRLLSEAMLAFDAVTNAAHFSVDMTFESADHTGRLKLTDTTGLEFITSRRYAKRGIAPVNVDDTRVQPLVTHAASGPVANASNVGEAFVRLNTGKHILHPVDMAAISLSIKNTSNNAIPFHSDGETGESNIILPGETMTIRLGQIAVRTLMIR